MKPAVDYSQVSTVPFPTYLPAPDSALYALLVEADAHAAWGVHVGNPWEELPSSWQRFMAHGMMLNYMASACTPSEMMSELLAKPPVGMEDPNEVFLHALSSPEAVVSFFLEATIDDQPVRWQGAFDPEVTRPRRTGFHTLELKQITGTEVLDLTDLPLFR